MELTKVENTVDIMEISRSSFCEETEYLVFREFETEGKTNRYYVLSKSQHILGTIKWYGAWRQYCFYPQGTTIFNRTCLNDISKFVGELQALWIIARDAKRDKTPS